MKRLLRLFALGILAYLLPAQQGPPPIAELQEPEAQDLRTGKDLPAPELLGGIADLPPMTLQNFLAIAEQKNPTLAQARQNVVISQQRARQVSLPPDPVVGYSGDHIRGGSYGGGEQGAFFSQEFVLGHKLALRRDTYLAEGRANEFRLETQRARIRNGVATAFFETLAAQQSVTVYNRLVKVALDAQLNSHELMRIGQADAADVLNAEVAAEQAKIEFETSQRMFLASFTRLATLSGQGSLPVHPITGTLVTPPAMDAEALVMTNIHNSPYVKQAEANVQVGEARLKNATRERIPNLTLKAGEWNSGEMLPNSNGRAGWESFAEASVQLPLWNRNQGNIAASKAELARAQSDVIRAELWTRNQLESCAQHYLAARATAQRYSSEILPRARRAFELELMKYQQMAQPYPRVLSAQRMLFTLQLSYIQALENQWTSAIALENYALAGALDAPPRPGEDETSINRPTDR